MSVTIMASVWKNSKHKGSNLLLLLAIADNADDEGFCWPGVQYLAGKIRMTPQSVINITRRLEESGELHAHHNRRHGNRYLVTVGMTEDEVKVGLNKFNYPEAEYKTISKNLLIKMGFSSELKPILVLNSNQVLKESSTNHQENHQPGKNSQNQTPPQQPNAPPQTPTSEKSPPQEPTSLQALDAFLGREQTPPVSPPPPIDWNDPAVRDAATIRSTQRYAHRDAPWRVDFTWLDKPRHGISADVLQHTAHALTQGGIVAPESDRLRQVLRSALPDVYKEAGGDFALIKRAGKSILEAGLEYWPPHRYAQMVSNIKSKRGAVGSASGWEIPG